MDKATKDLSLQEKQRQKHFYLITSGSNYLLSTANCTAIRTADARKNSDAVADFIQCFILYIHLVHRPNIQATAKLELKFLELSQH